MCVSEQFEAQQAGMGSGTVGVGEVGAPGCQPDTTGLATASDLLPLATGAS